MSEIYIIVTVDYEIFGNGKGNVQKCLVKPTDQILKIAEKYKVPITLMAEMCEFWAFENEELNNRLPKGYTPATWIKQQLIRAICSGNDVQLHLHPQWNNYSFDEGRKSWIVDFDYWKISSLSIAEINYLLRKGKNYLENLLKPFNSEYQCISFRAGALSIQPEKHVLKALYDQGFKIDSTVAHGCQIDNPHTKYSFTSTPRKPYWFVKENLNIAMENGILELPIYTMKFSIMRKVYNNFLNKTRGVLHYKDNLENNNYQNQNIFFLNKLFSKFKMFDFCEFSDIMLLKMIARARKEFADYQKIPIVMIGHSKIFQNHVNFESFLQKALNQGCRFSTLSGFYTQDL